MDNRQSVVIQMLELIVNEDYTNARKLCKDAERENGDVLQKYDIQMSGQNTLNEVQEVIRDLKNNQKKSAKNKATRLLPAVRGVLSEASTHTLSEVSYVQIAWLCLMTVSNNISVIYRPPGVHVARCQY